MKSPLKTFFVFGCVFLSVSISSAQERPIIWGQIPRADLEMKSFPSDTSASAVILCDYGESYFDDHLELVHERHCRIKILNPNGYDLGTVSVAIYDKDGTERLMKLKGATYAIDSSGTMITNELKSDDVFEERTTSDYLRHKFTLPALSPGCVIEYSYVMLSSSFHSMPDWVFQWREPVRWSEYKVRTPRAISYAAVVQGYERFHTSTQKEVTQVFRPPATGYLGSSGIVECIEQRYVAQNLRALRDEPFITTLNDYANKVDFQLGGYAFVGTGVRTVLESWPKLIEELLQSESFGDMIDVTGDVEDLVEEITKGSDTQEKKMRAIYHWIATSIVWDGTHRTYALQEVDDLLESKRGNNAEITFLMLSMLEAAGIQGQPVLLSTRSNGKVQTLYPILSQFNYILARVTIGEKHFYLDATNPSRPMELLPAKVLNVKGLIIQPEKEEWVTLNASSRSVLHGKANVRIDPEGNANGEIEIFFADYANLFVRDGLKEQTDLEFAKEVLDADAEAVEIDSAIVDNRTDPSEPLALKAWVTFPSLVHQSGDLMYINPNLLFRVKDNPFKERTRNFPVDYSYGREHASTVTLAIPEGYEIKERFPDRGLSIFDNIRFTRRLDISEQSVQLTNNFQILSVTFDPPLYARLRNLYGVVVSAHSDQLVFQRKAAISKKLPR
ncbi:MAG: transglutaminase domain-containing protein [Bacteroidota bacterium]